MYHCTGPKGTIHQEFTVLTLCIEAPRPGFLCYTFKVKRFKQWNKSERDQPWTILQFQKLFASVIKRKQQKNNYHIEMLPKYAWARSSPFCSLNRSYIHVLSWKHHGRHTSSTPYVLWILYRNLSKDCTYKKNTAMDHGIERQLDRPRICIQ